MADTAASTSNAESGRAVPQERSGLRGAIARLAAGKGVAMGIALAATPILTRLYSPANFGTLAILTTLAAVLAPTATLCYVRALPLVPDRVGRRDLVVLCFAILILGIAILTVAAPPGAGFLAALYGVPELRTYAFVLPLMFAIGGTEQIVTMLLNCERKFGLVAIRDVITSAVTAVCGTLAGLLVLGGSTAGLLLGIIIGTSAGALFSGINAVTQVLCRVDDPLQRRNLLAAALEYRKFPAFINWGATINVVTISLPVLMLGVFFSVQVVGFYSVAHRLISLPLSLFTLTSSQAFYVEAAAAVGHGQSARKVTEELVRYLSLLTNFPMFAAFFLAPSIFAIVLGPTWREAGVYTQILAPWIAIMAVASPLTGMYAIVGKQGEFLGTQVVIFLGRTGALLLGGLAFKTPIPTLTLFAIVGVAINLWVLWRCTGLADTSRKTVAGIIVQATGQSALFLAPAGCVAWLWQADLAAVVLGAAGALAYSFLLAHRYRHVLLRFVPNTSP